MNIGIIVHSHTGNTLSVAERLQEALLAKGHTVRLQRVEAVNEDPQSREPVRLKSNPDISQYDAVILGAPVRGFSLSPVMKAYLGQIPDISGKNAACFVTQHFKKPWLGGNRSVKQMCVALLNKGAGVTGTCVINWSGKTREEQISHLVETMSKLF